MKSGDTPLRDTAEKTKPVDILQKLINAFVNKGWLKQTIRIRHRDRKYRVFCSDREFFAYRINDHCGVSPGFPGWLVCVITNDKIVDDSIMSNFASTEPSAHDWLHCIVDGDFELI